jgi:hypothetical protein
MCRSIKTLRREDEPATEDEIRAAALQFVRKVSGYRQPSRRNQEAFEAAVTEIAVSSKHLLQALNGQLTAAGAESPQASLSTARLSSKESL